MKKFLAFLSFLFFNHVNAQWTSKTPFEQKVFVENKGQYELKPKASKEEILFGARQDGLQYYFTKSSIYIKHTALVKRSEEEIEAEMERLGVKEAFKTEEKEFAFKQVDEFHQMSFLDACSWTKIETEEQVIQLYNFSTGNKNISAHAYKKITYKDLYPGIDMEFYFPEGKQGFKYNFILKPGADASQIKMEFPLAEELKLSSKGDLTVKSAFGDFIDHAPIVSNQIANCSFNVAKGVVGFSLGDYDKTKELIIDPWTTTPGFSGAGSVFDVDWDFAGNCYAYGGYSPFQLIKYDNTGAQQWVYTTNFANSGGGAYYGDFAVDKNSQSVYIVDGFNGAGATMEKVNKNGTFNSTFPGNAAFQEMWRVSFDMCNGRPIIAGGGTTNPSFTGCTLDTNLTSVNPVNIINAPSGLHDMWGLALDANGNAYFATAKTQTGSPGYDNTIFKVPNPALSPITFSIVTTYSFIEVGSVTYEGWSPSNGFNGMAAGDTNLFAYDGYVLTRYSTLSGLATGSLNVNGSSLDTMGYGGITTDGCGNLFLGVNDSIKQYDVNFNFINGYHVNAKVYDMSLGNGVLYAAGKGFVTAINVGPSQCNPCSGGIAGVNMSLKNNDEFSIFPNPTTNNVNIEFVKVPENTKIALYNTMGQKLQSQAVNQKNLALSLENLPEGIYMIEVSSAEKTIVSKLVKYNR